jgi:uncharacterized protein (TIGR03083 family)
MTVDAARDVAEIRPISFATDATEIGLAAYMQLIAFLETLERSDWEAVTDCAPWTVADMVGHVIGAAEAQASLLTTTRQQLWGLRHKREFDGNPLDATNAFQIRQHHHLSPPERISTLRRVAPDAVRGRERFPRLLRRVRVPLAPSGSAATGLPTSLALGELMDVIYTRDTWLHRIDIARAVGRSLDLDTDADRRVVEDVVAAWARRHDQPFVLRLTGPAGGFFRQGRGGERIELDEIEFCRVLSGRAPGEGLLAVPILF